MRFLGMHGARKLAEEWATGEPEAIEAVQTLLRVAGLTMDAVMAQAFADNIQVFEQIERIIRMNTRQRDDNLREIARRRAGSNEFRRVTMQIENADFAQSAKDKMVADSKADADKKAEPEAKLETKVA
jgi:hypothetical protein